MTDKPIKLDNGSENRSDRRTKEQIFFFALFSLWVLLFLSSCDRRELTYYLESEVTVLVDWSGSRLPREEASYGTTVIFYPEDGGEPKAVLMGSREGEKVYLPEGRYQVLVFNRSFNDFGGVAFRGFDALETSEAYAKQVETREGSSNSTTRVVVKVPEWLASDVVENFEVTESMLGNYGSANTRGVRNGIVIDDNPEHYIIRLSPRPLMTGIKVLMHVKGLNNVRSAVCMLDGIDEAASITTGEGCGGHVAQLFELENPVFDPGSPFNGTLSADFGCLDFDRKIAHNLRFRALLVDGKTLFEQTFEKVEIHESVSDDNHGTITLSLELTTNLIPDVKPEGGADSDFDAEVGDWGDEENSNIYL